MRYVGSIYRPPSEAYSLLVQVTIGCAHNKCTFCTMFKDKRFTVRPEREVMEDLDEARTMYRRVDRIFLCDGDALCLANGKLLPILKRIRELFPECERVGIYGRAKDILRKGVEELKELVNNGLKIVYIGAESGSDIVLGHVNKGETRKEIIESVKKAEDAGMVTSVTFISGLGGRDLMEEHAEQTGKMISEMGASYVGLLTLMLDPSAPICDEIKRGAFRLLSAGEVLRETYIMLRAAAPERPCVFRSNHASNYVSLRGNLPEDKERMLKQLEHAMSDPRLLKAERSEERRVGKECRSRWSPYH